MADVKLKKLILNRNVCINEIESVKGLAARAKTDKSARTLFRVRYSEIEDVRCEFLKHQNNIVTILLSTEGVDEDALAKEEDIRKTFLDCYFEARSVYTDMYDPEEAGLQNLSLTRKPSFAVLNTSASSSVQARLPKVELPKFRGDYKNFNSFKELFDSLVHNNVSLSDVTKFNYLISSLESQPLSLVKTLPMTADNYSIAYKTLVDRYSNKRICAQAHWAALENTNKINCNNSGALRKLLDEFSENISALKNLGFPTDEWDFVLFNMLIKRIDNAAVTQFEIDHGSTSIPSYNDLVNFLNKYCIAYDTINAASSSSELKNRTAPAQLKDNNKFRSHAFFSELKKGKQDKCSLCNNTHPLHSCPQYLKETPRNRFSICKKLHVCLNCLSSMHVLKMCKSKHSCRTCKKQHHSTLHFEEVSTAPSSQSNESTTNIDSISPQPTPFSGSAVNDLPIDSPNGVLLSTALIEVLDNSGCFHTLRCLLDSGSMISFITKRAVNLLGLPKSELDIDISGLDSMHTNSKYGGVTLTFRPIGCILPAISTDVVILNKICQSLPSAEVDIEKFTHIKNLKLADAQYYSPGPIDVLLGADVFSKIVLNGRIAGSGNQPDAINTIFGYVLMGKVPFKNKTHTHSFLTIPSYTQLEQDISKFWELESVPSQQFLKPDDELCDRIFDETHFRDSAQRYVVHLPFRGDLPSFEGSRDLAVQRFLTLERRLLKNESIYRQYCDFMKEYLVLNHMEIVSDVNIPARSYYIPHFHVLRPSSSSTKLRVVFNASAKCSNNTSLNDHLLSGKKLQQDILALLVTFRLNEIALCADVKQMFRMIRVNPPHCDFQRIVFRFSTDHPIQDFKLLTVTYGTTCAPYLANRVLLQLASDEEASFPRAAEVIRHATYVDDLVCGSSSIEKAKELMLQLISLFKKGGFELRKWSSNEPSILADLPSSHLSVDPLTFDDKQEINSLKILGLQWLPTSDTFTFSANISDRKCSKRHLLSELAKIYDPVGYLGPVTFYLKYLIQKLWTFGTSWDTEPPQEIVRIWDKFKSELLLLKKVSISRKILVQNAICYQLHGFADASERGYAAVVYLKSFDSFSSVRVKLIGSKTKVAPLKKITIPRLELCAAFLLTKFMAYIVNIFNGKLPISRIQAWSDSKIALCWIKSHPHRWKTFVSNRVAIIQELIPSSNWGYVESALNPADIASRGAYPSEFLNYSQWFDNPSFLMNHHEDNCKTTENHVQTEECQAVANTEARNISSFLVTQSESTIIKSLMNKFSSFSKLQRVFAYIIRFVKHVRNRKHLNLGNLSSKELDEALFLLVKHTQREFFLDEIQHNKFSKPLKRLKPFLDEFGVLRVGGRLKHSQLPFNSKHPMLLPRDSPLTRLLIEFYHKKYLHVGLRTLSYLLMQRFWILSPKRAIFSVLSKCLTCLKAKPIPFQPPMGNLPSVRISQIKPFLHCGVDYGGPFKLLMNRYRGVKTCKAYICLFVCYSTKAIHLELATDLSTNTFLAALQRFISRRGRVNHLYSDCGSNFIGSTKFLKSIMREAAEKESIEWHFNPPSAPHFGGLWEAGIKSVKYHIARVVGEQILSYEEFNTLLTLIESVLNSRPLTPLTSDIEEICALTPNHFLNLDVVCPLPMPDFSTSPVNRLNRFQLIQKLHQSFWQRWQKEYLHTLQQRGKWFLEKPNPEIGTLVLVKNENLPPAKWPLGRIETLSVGSDGVGRIATVRTANGLFKRPLVKLCPLPDA